MNRSTFTLFIVLQMLLAISARADDQYPAAPDLNAPKKARVTYLGVSAKPIDDTLSVQLDLPDGVGLTVTTVDHDGPAAGEIKANDVLEKLDDQLLIDAHQLVTLIRLHHAGDVVTLTVIRAAKPVLVKIKLGEKLRPVTAGNPPDHNLPGDNTPDDLNERIPMIQPAPMQLGNQVMFTFKDDVYTAEVHGDKAGHKNLTVKDLAGKVVAEGLIDTPEQWQKFPLQVREHLEVLHKMIVDPAGK